jgi:translation initiation factor 2B subunit (eIF-2B alpha/beta/delta family)
MDSAQDITSAQIESHIRDYIPLRAEYQQLLEQRVQDIKTDYFSGARGLADKALSHLIWLIKAAVEDVKNGAELVKVAKAIVQHLSNTRPAMSAAIYSALARALEECVKKASPSFSNLLISTGTEEVKAVSQYLEHTLSQVLKQRKKDFEKLGFVFSSWIATNNTEYSHLNILTLSNSSSIRNCIVSLVEAHLDLDIHLIILESRPRFEGADMAAALLSSRINMTRLRIHIAPDCAVATVAKKVHIVLLGADRISSTGRVSNKIGSLAAALCGRAQNPQVKVIVASDTDKIVPPKSKHDSEVHPREELTAAWNQDTERTIGKNASVFGHWFEWVPAEHIDLYCTEQGMMKVDKITEISKQLGSFEPAVFGAKPAEETETPKSSEIQE